MSDPTDEQLDEHARRLMQIRTSTPTELVDADLEALALVHRDGCVRMAAAELLTARAHITALAAAHQRVQILITRGVTGEEYEHDHGIGDGHDACPACWADDIRRALEVDRA